MSMKIILTFENVFLTSGSKVDSDAMIRPVFQLALSGSKKDWRWERTVRKQGKSFRRDRGNSGLNQGNGGSHGEMLDVGDSTEVSGPELTMDWILVLTYPSQLPRSDQTSHTHTPHSSQALLLSFQFLPNILIGHLHTSNGGSGGIKDKSNCSCL